MLQQTPFFFSKNFKFFVRTRELHRQGFTSSSLCSLRLPPLSIGLECVKLISCGVLYKGLAFMKHFIVLASETLLPIIPVNHHE
jgi:hypothetical protein